MTRFEHIQEPVAALDGDDLKRFAELQAELWDKQIETDAKAGLLDRLAEQALADHKAGRTLPL